MLLLMNSNVIIELPYWAYSAKKHAISLSKSSENPERPILLIGGVHGDEPEGVWLAEETLEWLKSNTEKSRPAGVPWIIIPCLNPDGFNTCDRVNGNGVDLNRNYPSKSWSPKHEKARYNPGPEPGSESEIKALSQLIQTVKPRLIIHCHSWHPCIVYTGEPALKAAQMLSEVSGYALKDDIGYPTPGSLSQYGWHDNQFPVICIEEAEGTMQKDIWPHFEKAFEFIFYPKT